MAQYNPYLHFRGNTEQAFSFYKSILGGEFTKIARFKDMPIYDEYKVPEEHLNKIMYIALPLGKHNILIGSDAILESEERTFTFGDNFHIAISADSREEADYLFTKLSEGGKTEMPISESPWGTYFGMLADKYGVQWTVEYNSNS